MSECSEIQPHLSAFVDGLLPSATHAAVLAHARTCHDCGSVLRDFEQLLLSARQLGTVAPPDHVWIEIAGRLRQDVGGRAVAVEVPHRGRAWVQWAGLSAALLAITAVLYVFRGQPTAPAASSSGTAGSVQVVNDELTLAMQHYERAVAELELVTNSGAGTIDPAVAQAVRTSLDSIDQAIAESRAALSSNPDSEPARGSLFQALRQKISVLQATVALINDVRQGDSEGAAHAVAGPGRQS